MSRIGNRILTIPSGVTITYANHNLNIKNGKNELNIAVPSDDFNIEIKDQKFSIKPKNNPASKQESMLQGTINALVRNALIGLTEGCFKELKIVGVGYKAVVTGNTLTLSLGYSKPVIMQIPAGLKVECRTPTEMKISGFDKELVGEFAAIVRSKRPPEPYKGKGVMYVNEVIQRKVGKTAETTKGAK